MADRGAPRGHNKHGSGMSARRQLKTWGTSSKSKQRLLHAEGHQCAQILGRIEGSEGLHL